MSLSLELESLEGRTLLSAPGHKPPPPPPVPPEYAPHSKVEGKTLGAWGDQWWKWAFSYQTAENPLFDLTGAQGAKGDAGSDRQPSRPRSRPPKERRIAMPWVSCRRHRRPGRPA